MAKPDTTVIVPTIRERNMVDWLARWESQLKDCRIIVIEDNPAKTFRLESKSLAIDHYCWQDIEADLGDNAWIIPRGTGCIRSFGLIKAWQQNPEMIITMDDDCYPDDEDYLQKHASALFERQYPQRWFQHAQTVRVRGVPMNLAMSKPVVNMGLWSHVPDLDGITQIEYPDVRLAKSNFSFAVPFGYYAPISSMNVAFRMEAIPASYFLLMGKAYEYDRFGDIWMGVFVKKICDHLGAGIVGGDPYVRHERASDPYKNRQKEESGIPINEQLWQDVDKIRLSGNNFAECYISLAEQLPVYSEYWSKLKQAMRIWAELFQ